MPVYSLTQTLHAHLTTDDRKRSPYFLLPFDVPGGIVQLTVHYRYTNALRANQAGHAAGNIVDLGLFDPRGCAFLTAQGFRGWSGTARDRVTLTPTEATPGYLPGPIYPGTWHAILGLYQLAPEGCDVIVEVTMTPGLEGPGTPGSQQPGMLDKVDDHAAKTEEGLPTYAPLGVLRNAPGWYRGDLHCHTHHSDATADVGTVAAVARAQGLDFVAVTEHNTVSHLPELARHSGPDLLLIPGVEITTYHGHANVWGVRTWQEFRASTEAQMRHIREHVREQGLLFSINHPKQGGPAWAFETTMDADAVEAWQAPWWVSNHLSLDFWDRLLRQGQRPTLVGGSDKHQRPFEGTLSLYEVGTPTTWVYAERLSEADILAGIRAGHVYLSQDPRGPRLAFTARVGKDAVQMGDELHVPSGTRVTFRCRVQGAERGWLLRTVNKRGEAFRAAIEDKGEDTHTWQVTASEDDYWRVEVIAPPQAPLDAEPAALVVFALSNPIYVRVEAGQDSQD